MKQDNLWFVGLIIASFSIFIKVLGTNLQKFSHKNEERSYFRNLHWVCGMTLVILGCFTDMAALAFAPQSTIASLGGLTLVTNIYIAKLLLGEVMRKIQYLTTFIIIIGTTFTVIYSPKTEKKNNIDELKKIFESGSFIFYIITIGILVFIIRFLNYKFNKSGTHQKLRSILISISSGIIGAQNLFFGKTLIKLISFSIKNKTTEIFSGYLVYINLLCLCLTIFVHVKWINEALKEFHSTLVVPINKSTWMIVAILAGIFVMKEDFHLDEEDGDEDGNNIGDQIGFSFGIILIIFGLIFHSYFDKVEEVDNEDFKLESLQSMEIKIENN
jgi:hypothetical protein